jgi:dimethylglycine dehydrogenase
MEAGREFSIVNFGYRALDSLRMEKGYRFWGFDITAATTPLEAGLDRFVKLDKGEFIGRAALLRQQQTGLARVLACLATEGSNAIPHGWEPVLAGETIVGYVTSGDYGHFVEKTIALAYVSPSCAAPGTRLSVKIMGESVPAAVAPSPLYDPGNASLKS